MDQDKHIESLGIELACTIEILHVNLCHKAKWEDCYDLRCELAKRIISLATESVTK